MGGGGNGKAKWKCGSKNKQSSASQQHQSNNAKKAPASAAAKDRRKEDEIERIDLSASAKSISPDLQQLLLNVFKHALFTSISSDRNAENTEEGEEKDINMQIQQLKTHLYNRDFESAFADASPSLLRAYALRWSASRSLAYCGLFRGIVDCALESGHRLDDGDVGDNEKEDVGVLCIGGGAGAEIVALAGAWRVLQDEQNSSKNPTTDESPVEGIEALSLNNETTSSSPKRKKRKLAITAIDIAEWSDVVHRVTTAIHSADIFGAKTCAAPLIHGQEDQRIDICFNKMDILALSEEDLKSLLRRQRVISLMFTLNELFSTSISKTTQFLLRMTDITDPGTILMVVDSPGSYSTLSFTKTESSDTQQQQQQQQRQYPMKFLLDHTLLSVAEGSWEKLVSQDSRWFRKEANQKLHYNVDLEGGQGFIKLEDMRFQIHVYRRLASSSRNE
ncbi:hypothetical protein EYB25_002883 [Talaromyces marneffei]|uniref:25S rRNA (Uridine(2843)-N(3))-methyltransferase n=1 Tax=Talaromyces marneffei PM1 TaxID=1077442 RepID=A0A093VE20_TALMA|nr:hypothetical protein EYB25_002883 [Talaromyces marneffei]